MNVGVEVNLALAYYLSAMVPHVSGKAREVVNEMARYLGEEAFEAIQDSNKALKELRELVTNDAKKTAQVPQRTKKRWPERSDSIERASRG